MSAIDEACQAYERLLSEPWKDHLSGHERIWMLTYRPDSERRLRYRLPLFHTATENAGLVWHPVDITYSFEHWLMDHEYQDAYLEDPELLQFGALDEFEEGLAEQLKAELATVDDRTVTALLGAASLFGLVRLSRVLSDVAGDIPGRMLVFFPGTRDDNNYRLLDGYDGWNYLAIPIN